MPPCWLWVGRRALHSVNTHTYIFFLQLRGHVLRFIASVLVEVGWSTTSTSSHLGGAADAVRHWHSERRVSKNIHIHHCMEKLKWSGRIMKLSVLASHSRTCKSPGKTMHFVQCFILICPSPPSPGGGGLFPECTLPGRLPIFNTKVSQESAEASQLSQSKGRVTPRLSRQFTAETNRQTAVCSHARTVCQFRIPNSPRMQVFGDTWRS